MNTKELKSVLAKIEKSKEKIATERDKMTHKLIRTPNYLLVVDDSEIKEGDYHVAIRIVKTNGDKAIAFTDQKQLDAIAEIGGAKKIIAHLPLNNSPILEGVDLLAPLETEDFNPTGEYTKEYMSSLMFDGKSFVSDVLLATRVGYNKAKEKYKYTLKDINIMVNNCVTFAISNTHLSVGEYATQFKDFYDKCIQSLSQPKMPMAFECDVKSFEQEYRIPIREVRITTPEGHTQWVGRYIY